MAWSIVLLSLERQPSMSACTIALSHTERSPRGFLERVAPEQGRKARLRSGLHVVYGHDEPIP